MLVCAELMSWINLYSIEPAIASGLLMVSGSVKYTSHQVSVLGAIGVSVTGMMIGAGVSVTVTMIGAGVSVTGTMIGAGVSDA